MKRKINRFSLVFLLTTITSITHAQVKVESDGSLYVNSTTPDWGRAMWTKVHNQYACSYHLNNTYYNDDMFYVRGDGYVFATLGYLTSSDSLLKTDIKRIGFAMETIKKLRGVTYNRIMNERESKSKEYGLIAQEVQKVLPEAVVTMQDSKLAISYQSLIPVLIEAIKEQQVQIEIMKIELMEQKIRLSALNAEQLNPTSEKGNILYQNVPNPFHEQSQIAYFLTQNIKSAFINIYDMNGGQLKSFILDKPGNGSISINGKELKSGMYLYALVVDGQIIDTKRMLLTD